MKVLEVNTEKTWRGGERQTFYTLEGFKKQGVIGELLCLESYPLFEKAKCLNIPIHGVGGQLEAVKFLIKSGRNYDIIHAQSAKAQSLAVLTKMFHRKPIVYTRRVDFVPKGMAARLKYRLTDKVVAISIPIRDILENFGVEDVDVIPALAVKKKLSRERGDIFKKEIGIQNKKIVGTIAALVPHKDPFTMVEAVRELSILRNDFVFLHFGDGELRGAISERIRMYHLEPVYKLMGFYEDVEDFFDILDLFVMSSSEEGLGSSVLDAFLYRVPVVSTDAGGLEETVRGRGLLCSVGDYRCIAGAINGLLESNDLRGELTRKAHDDVNRFYTMEGNIEQYVRIFETLTWK